MIKGAAANLMCSQLRDTAKALEKAGSAGNEVASGDKAAIESAWSDVKQNFSELKQAMKAYNAFLSSIGI